MLHACVSLPLHCCLVMHSVLTGHFKKEGTKVPQVPVEKKKKNKENPLPYLPSIKAGTLVGAYQGRGLATNLTRLAFGITRRNQA